MKSLNFSIIAALLTGIISAPTVHAAASTTPNTAGDGLGDGVIVVLGGVTASTCNVKSGDEYQVVRLPVIGTNAFKSSDGAGATKFSVKLEDCPEGAKVGIFFDATSTTELAKGWMKAYIYDGAAYNSTKGEISNKQLDKLFAPATTNKDHYNTVKADIGTLGDAGSKATAQSKLFFRLLNSNFEPMTIGSDEQRDVNKGMWAPDVVGADGTAEVFGAVEYVVDKDKSPVAVPDAGYYYSYSTFTLQYN